MVIHRLKYGLVLSEEIVDLGFGKRSGSAVLTKAKSLY